MSQNSASKKAKKNVRRPRNDYGNLKALKVQQDFTSDVLYNFLRNRGGNLVASIERLAVLLRYTSDSPTINRDISQYFEHTILGEAAREAGSLEAQKAEAEDQLAVEIPQVVLPDSHAISYNITHPVYWTVLHLIQRVDKALNQIEILFLAGVITQQQMDHCRHQAVSLFNRVSQKIFLVTSPGKREGQPYSVKAFIQALKKDGGMEQLMLRLQGSPVDTADDAPQAKAKQAPTPAESVPEETVTEETDDLRGAA